MKHIHEVKHLCRMRGIVHQQAPAPQHPRCSIEPQGQERAVLRDGMPLAEDQDVYRVPASTLRAHDDTRLDGALSTMGW